MRQRIIALILNVSKRDLAPGPEESLFDSGYLDSFALPEMVCELEREFAIRVPDADLNPRQFETVARIETYLASRG
ncbi:MAG TPA: acyl carrier protein [Bryobacteraceae bacterium]|nr:acyl carrier protein [Bryobacteraceae bacterium]